jgi:hypothetical protein
MVGQKAKKDKKSQGKAEEEKMKQVQSDVPLFLPGIAGGL